MNRVLKSWLAKTAIVALVAIWVSPVSLYAHTSIESVKIADDLGEVGRDFTFLDGNGKLRRLNDFHGDVVAVFFGFTHCPDVCPGFLTKASVVREHLGVNKDRFKVVFVTVDLERDSRAALTRYLDLFGNWVIGARIPGGELAEVTRDFAITNQLIKDANGRINVSHSIGAFLFDKNSRPAHYISSSRDPEYIADQIDRLLEL